MPETTAQRETRVLSLNRVQIFCFGIFVSVLVGREFTHNSDFLAILEENKKTLVEISDSMSHLTQTTDSVDNKTIKALDLIIESTNSDKE